MKPVLSSTEWGSVFDRLADATHAIADVASLLDTSAETDAVADSAKRIEMDLCILESRLRNIRNHVADEPDAA